MQTEDENGCAFGRRRFLLNSEDHPHCDSTTGDSIAINDVGRDDQRRGFVFPKLHKPAASRRRIEMHTTRRRVRPMLIRPVSIGSFLACT